MRRQQLHPRTAIINKNQKNKSKKARLEALKWLATKFPFAFDNRVRIQPLKRGILDDILSYAEEAAAEGISKSKLREAVVVFTRRIDYLASLKAKDNRIDLFGNLCGEVTEEEAAHAAAKIKRKVEKSGKSARKSIKSTAYRSPNSMAAGSFSYESNPNFPEKEQAPSGNFVTPVMSMGKSSSTVIKRKSAKTYDPSAVARLKEKLGLAEKNERN